MKASGGKTPQIGAELEHHGKREKSCQKRKENCIENIRAEIENSSVDHSGSSSVVQNDVELGEHPIVEGEQTTVAKYTELWKIM